MSSLPWLVRRERRAGASPSAILAQCKTCLTPRLPPRGPPREPDWQVPPCPSRRAVPVSRRAAHVQQRSAAAGAGGRGGCRLRGGRLPLADPDLHRSSPATRTTPPPGMPRTPTCPGSGRWFVVLAPVVAGLLYGPLVHFFAREARGHGVPEVMFAVARRGGRIAPQVAAVKALASALCIGGGGSVGREGPIVQIGSALGSTLGAGRPGGRGADARPGRLRRGRRYRRDLQRPAGRGVLRDGADPAATSRPSRSAWSSSPR